MLSRRLKIFEGGMGWHISLEYPEVAIVWSAKRSGVLKGGSWPESLRRLLGSDHFCFFFFLCGIATSISIVGTFNFILAKFYFVAIQLDILSENSYELLRRMLLKWWDTVIRTIIITLEVDVKLWSETERNENKRCKQILFDKKTINPVRLCFMGKCPSDIKKSLK